MEFSSTFLLSPTTLMVANLLPIIFVVAQSRLWYDPAGQKRLGTLASVVAVALSAGVIFFAWQSRAELDGASAQMIVLHLLPLVTIILLVTLNSSQTALARLRVGGGSTGDAPPTPKSVEGGKIDSLTWSDVVISDELKNELQTVISLLKDSSAAKRYGIDAPKGILLNGPPGTGKTTIAKVMASMAGMSFYVLKLDEVISQWVGESEKNLTRLFNAAQENAPAIIFIDEIDSIGKSRAGQVQWADNLLNHLLQLIDGVIRAEGIYILAATNRAELVDEALKRPGRLNRVIEIGLPTDIGRRRLFEIHTAKLHLDSTISLDALAQRTAGRSGADIKAICNQAGLNAFSRESSAGKKRDYRVTLADIERALQQFNVSAETL